MKTAFRAQAKNKMDSMSGKPLQRHDTDCVQVQLMYCGCVTEEQEIIPHPGHSFFFFLTYYRMNTHLSIRPCPSCVTTPKHEQLH